ncbi:hypothetical protein TorRG33x02_347870 [Trema orientale]|uniref:Uncharacterized protein n=1 Tax=Trema orientale TaxID=63057 RepID=A0A2P5AKX2_TREOI|nr:hypothetical protein TorRG33x02_347870 [Trema orientale]
MHAPSLRLISLFSIFTLPPSPPLLLETLPETGQNLLENQPKSGQKAVCSGSFFTRPSFAIVTSGFFSFLQQPPLDSPENSSVEVKTPLSWTTLSLDHDQKLEDDP